MKTEELLRRAEEYRRVREALGVYLVDLAGPGVGGVPGHLEIGPHALARVMRDLPPDEDGRRRDRREGSARAVDGAVRELDSA